MTAREPSAVEVIAEALAHENGTEQAERWKSEAAVIFAALKAAGFVVATRDEIRAMSVAEKAELIGGEACGGWLPNRGLVERVVGPWREVQP